MAHHIKPLITGAFFILINKLSIITLFRPPFVVLRLITP